MLETGIIIISLIHKKVRSYRRIGRIRQGFNRNFKSFNYDKFETKLTMYNDKMEKLYNFKFKYDHYNNQIIKIHYNHKNNIVLIFTLKSIFQLSLNIK